MKISVNNCQLVLYAERLETKEEVSLIKFTWDTDIPFGEIIEYAGIIPLPPYLHREAVPEDNITYQTIYSEIRGSVAAPTAGLHFTEKVFNSLKKKNKDKLFITLHVGAGTFRPVKSVNIEDHEMHAEHFFVSIEVLELIIGRKGTLVAVGTTSVRTLESLFWLGVKTIENPFVRPEEMTTDQWEPYNNNINHDCHTALTSLFNWMKSNKLTFLNSSTRIMIVPGYKFRLVEAIITNFHQPCSTLLLLISAWAGSDWKRIYQYALDNEFRFLSYGDSSLLFQKK